MSPPQRSVPRACSRASASSAAARPAAAIIATSTMPRSQPRAARFSGGTAGGQDFAARAMGRRMRTSIAALLLVLAVARAAPAGDATGAFAPYEDLLEVLADLTWHLKDDAYRFPPPKDPTGHDLYQLALHRLENWEKRYPGRLRDVTGFARAEALEHLGEYRTAADLYRQVAALPSPLAEHARQGAERAGAFAEAAALPEDAPDVDGALVALRAKLDAWGKVVARQGGTPWEPAALAEEERLEGVAARLVRSEEHTSELQSPVHLVCRLLLEKKKKQVTA